MSSKDLETLEKFMTEAIAEARTAESEGEVPVGAILVKEGNIVGRGRNRKETTPCATRHAEIEAIEDASRNLGVWRLSGCEMYVTLEPCVMCAGAIVAARIDRVVYGTADPKGGAIQSLYELTSDSRLNHNCEIITDVLQQECSKLLKDFFKAKREK